MPDNDHVLMDVAGAILDGGSVNWAAVDRSASDRDRQILEELRLLCSVADLHRHISQNDDERPEPGEPDQQYWGRLRLRQRIGGGAFGDVYRAWDARLDREVALKLIPLGDDPRDRQPSAILGEARLLARVRHPGVVTLYDAERIDGFVGLSMEFVDGETLQQRVERQGPFDADEAVRIGRQLCEALSAAHDAGVLHRDVKASNVVIKPDGGVVLMDFGAGRLLDHVHTDLTGTPLYLAPEVLNGQPATVRSDVYSLGVLLYYLLTGTCPVPAQSLSELKQAHQRRSASPPLSVVGAHPAIPADVGAVIQRAIDPREERRFRSPAALASRLGALPHRRGSIRTVASLTATAALVMMLVATPLLRAPKDAVRFAVLPFAISANVPDGEEVRQGLARGLITRLQRYDNARVVSSESVLTAAALNLPVPELGARLSVPLAVTGTINRVGDVIEAQALLVRTSDGRPLWSRHYRRSAPDVLDLQRAIAADLADRLQLRHDDGHQQRSTSNLEAYTLFVRGQFELDKFTDAGARAALTLFEQALVIEPAYAAAHASVALAYLRGYPAIPNLTRDEALRRAEAAAARAIALDGSGAESHLALALIKSARADPEGADRDFRLAVALGPGNVLVRQEYSRWLSLHARFEEALAHAREAKALSQLSARAVMAVASVLRFARDYEASLIETQAALALDPNFGAAYSNLGHNYQGLGRLNEAIDAFRRWRDPSGNLGNALAEAGRVDEARAMITVFEERYARTGIGAGDIAQIYCGLGEIDLAFEWLNRDKAGGWPTTFKVARVWDPLRADPRFTELLGKYGVD
jgi:serine/threonine-protein kinase